MVTKGLDYSIRKKFDPQSITDMSQLADKVCYVERLKTEKARVSKDHRKGKTAYVDTEDYSIEFEDKYMEEGEVNMAELKDGPPYACNPIRSSKGKMFEGPKNDNINTKTYTFYVSICDKIFDVLVSHGKVIVPPCTKDPPLEQKKRFLQIS